MSNHTSIRIPPPLRARLDRIMERDGVSLIFLITSAISMYLATVEKP